MPPDITGRDPNPSALVAIALAAKRSGDRQLLRDARRELSRRFGIALSFRREAAVRGVRRDE
jgi:hypothetical protein